MSTETILVTGATGFAGSHLTQALLHRGHRVRTLVRAGAPEPTVQRLRLAGAEIVEGDLTDPASVQRAARSVDAIYHIAALYRQARFPEATYWAVNHTGTENIVAAARAAGVRRLVHCSTVGVHGDVAAVPSDETAPFQPHDAYQKSKLAGELAVRRAIDDGLPAAIIRPAALYGPGDLRFLKLFRTIAGRQFVMIGSGRTLYHMVYIDDLVDGIIRAGERSEAVGEAFILAGPRYTTIQELASRVARTVGVRLRRGKIPLAPMQAAATACETLCRPLGIEPPLHRRRLDFFSKNRAFSTRKAEAMLGYAPRIDLAEGLRRTAAWYQEAGLLQVEREVPVGVVAGSISHG